MMQSPTDDSLVVFIGNLFSIYLVIGNKGINWITEDCGANYRALNSGKKIHEF